MSKKINLSKKLDFSDIDLTAPEELIEEYIQQISEQTKNIVMGKIVPYEGKIFSYSYYDFSGLKDALGATQKFDVQDTLGIQGDDSKKFEFYLTTPLYTHFKYRICYIQHGASNYPVTIVLDQTIINEINPDDSNYVIYCKTREEFEELIIKVIYSEQVINVMQELIRINQAKRYDEYKSQMP